MQKWEYLVIYALERINEGNIRQRFFEKQNLDLTDGYVYTQPQDYLNGKGADGWELISVTNTGGENYTWTYIFKRPKS